LTVIFARVIHWKISPSTKKHFLFRQAHGLRCRDCLYPFHIYAIRAAVPQLFCQRKAAVVLRKVAEGLRFDCSLYDSFGCYMK